jgi:hypothetical protein
MTSATQDPEIVEREVSPTLPMTGGGTVDVQVQTARRFPRSITTFIRRATEMATLTPEIAASCVYALPRGGKTIEGPSARLAEIVASAWTNLRVQAGATDNDERYITARGEAWDVETNVAIGFEVRRRITNRKGDTYDDDMITVTGNAAASIALRNAVFKAVPSSFWKPIYQKCRQVIAGDAKTFAARRDELLKAFMVAGVTHEQLCQGIGLKGVQDITMDHMVTLVGILNAIKEGETTVEDAFVNVGGHAPAAQPSMRKSQQQTPPEPAAATSVPPTTQPAESAAPKSPVGKIVDVREGSKSKANAQSYIIKNEHDFVCATWSTTLADAARGHRAAGNVVELSCKPAKDARYAPTLEEILPAETATEAEPATAEPE